MYNTLSRPLGGIEGCDSCEDAPFDMWFRSALRHSTTTQDAVGDSSDGLCVVILIAACKNGLRLSIQSVIYPFNPLNVSLSYSYQQDQQ